ncbi:MAG: metal ABC transporter substrate-binding protein [Micrococcales bacterium]|nr:metal ABC transporter substrate-binding protein [Micrococcales bacterium]
MSLLRTVRNWTALQLVLAEVAITGLTLVGCSQPAGQAGLAGSNDGANPDQVAVLASFYPLQWVAQQVAGPDVAIGSLTPPGAEPHDAELTPAGVAGLGQADLVVTLSGFQPAVDQAIAARAPKRVVDAAQVVSLVDGDPHFWLDPLLLAELAQPIADQLRQIDPAGGDGYQQRASQLVSQLEQLDQDFSASLADLSGATLVTTHAAFGYLARRYQLSMITVSGIDPDQEPSPARLRQVRQQIEPLGLETIFSESTTTDKTARTLADQVKANVKRLDPIETAPSRGDYLTAMKENLQALSEGLVAVS